MVLTIIRTIFPLLLLHLSSWFSFYHQPHLPIFFCGLLLLNPSYKCLCPPGPYLRPLISLAVNFNYHLKSTVSQILSACQLSLLRFRSIVPPHHSHRIFPESLRINLSNLNSTFCTMFSCSCPCFPESQDQPPRALHEACR